MALVPPGAEIPEGSVVMGVPGKVVATRDNFAQTRRNALIYHRNALAYARGKHDAWRGEEFARFREDLSRRLAAGEDVGVVRTHPIAVSAISGNHPAPRDFSFSASA